VLGEVASGISICRGTKSVSLLSNKGISIESGGERAVEESSFPPVGKQEEERRVGESWEGGVERIEEEEFFFSSSISFK